MTPPLPPLPPPPPSPPDPRWRYALIAVIPVMYAAAFGAKHLRAEHIHRPVCERVCGKRGMRYEGVEQARKSDRAVACKCVSPSHDRATIKTTFFFDNALLDWVAGEATSTLGVIFGPILLLTAAVMIAGRLVRSKR